jgi:hypothetical protein
MESVKINTTYFVLILPGSIAIGQKSCLSASEFFSFRFSSIFLDNFHEALIFCFFCIKTKEKEIIQEKKFYCTQKST